MIFHKSLIMIFIYYQSINNINILYSIILCIMISFYIVLYDIFKPLSRIDTKTIDKI